MPVYSILREPKALIVFSSNIRRHSAHTFTYDACTTNINTSYPDAS